MEPLKIPKNPLYFCEKCQYKTNNKKDFTKHEMTLKHQNETKMEQNIPNVPNNPIVDILSNKYYCTICNIQMNSKTTFWRHKQTCNNHTNTNNDPSKKDDLIDYLIKENQEFKSLILELIKKDNNVINNNNTNTTAPSPACPDRDGTGRSTSHCHCLRWGNRETDVVWDCWVERSAERR